MTEHDEIMRNEVGTALFLLAGFTAIGFIIGFGLFS
jgi:hypothetical protein